MMQSAMSSCVNRCRMDYQTTRWTSDHRMCTQTSTYRRCVEETLQNVKIYCAQRCADNPRAFEPEATSSARPPLQIDPTVPNPTPRHRGNPTPGGIRG